MGAVAGAVAVVGKLAGPTGISDKEFKMELMTIMRSIAWSLKVIEDWFLVLEDWFKITMQPTW